MKLVLHFAAQLNTRLACIFSTTIYWSALLTKQLSRAFAEAPAFGNMATTQPKTSFFQVVKIKTVEKAEGMECDAQ